MHLRFISFAMLVGLTLTLSAGTPKYIVYFSGDGMGLGHVLTADTYNRTVRTDGKHLTMLQFPVTSVALSYSASSKITDSAAAGTALSTGTKTRNYMLGMNPDTVPCYSVAHELKNMGYGVAVATSVAVDDATPAAFYAHVPNRKKFYEIGLDLAKSGYDMFVGTKLRGLKDKSGKETDLLKVIDANGYTIANGPKGYEKAKNCKKLLLLNTDTSVEHNGYTIDSVADNLKLPFITKACIEHLSKVSPDKFFIMVEGGNIDWAAHANDAATVVKEIVNFDESIAVAYNFYLSHPDETLIIVTADHNTGGMALGVEKGPKNINLRNFDFQRISLETLQRKCSEIMKSNQAITWDEMRSYLKDNFGLYGYIEVNAKRDKQLRDKFNKTFIDRKSTDEKTLYATFSEFVATVFDVLDHCTGIGWTSHNHTGDFTPVFAIGVGVEEFGGLNKNIDLPAKIRRLTGIK